MSEIYKEAILEAKKLREVAEIDAKNKIIEAVSPIIKRMITKEATEASKYLFGEDDLGTPSMDDAPISDPLSGINPTDMSGMTAPDMPAGAPITASGDLGGMPMPDDEGKITLDFQQLFSLGGMGSAGMSGQPPVPSGVPDINGGLDAGQSPGQISPVPTPGQTPLDSNPMSAAGEIPPVPPIAPGASTNPGDQTIPPATPVAGAPAPGQTPVPGATGELLPPPAATPEEEEIIQPVAENKIVAFKNDVVVVAEKIDLFLGKHSSSTLIKESIKTKLFGLCEQVDSLVSAGILNKKMAESAEHKLEFLYSSLNEAKQDNSYKEDKGTKMTTLKEFAAKLFEEDALGPATADKATAHAEKVSGIQPGVDLFKEQENKDSEDMKAMAESLLGEDAPASTAFGDGKAEGNAETKSPDVHNDAKNLAKEKGAGIVSETAPSSTAFGDGQKASGAENTSPKVHAGKALADEAGANTILEFDEKELREAIAKVRKENLARKLATVKEGVKAAGGLKGTDKDGHLKTPKVPEGDQGSAKPEGGKDPSQKNLKEETVALSVGGAGDVEGSSDPLAGSDAGTGGDEVELTFQIDVDDLEALLSGGVADFIAEPTSMDSGTDLGGASDDISSDVSDEIEVVDDETPEGEEGLLMDKEKDLDETPAAGPASPAVPMQESTKTTTAKKTVNELKNQLRESQLLTAKALYVSKFAVSNDLTSRQKQKIAEYFDKAKTLAEAKETYQKIKKILSESTSSSKLSGSASKPTATGSAKILEEGTQKGGSDSIEMQRWMLLAGIKSKK